MNKVAGAVVDITLSRAVQQKGLAVFHIDNPHPQLWSSALEAFGAALGVSKRVSYAEWLERVKANDNVSTNPAHKLMHFFIEELPLLADDSVRYDTSHTSETSESCRGMPEKLSAEYFAKTVQFWKSRGYLS